MLSQAIPFEWTIQKPWLWLSIECPKGHWNGYLSIEFTWSSRITNWSRSRTIRKFKKKNSTHDERQLTFISDIVHNEHQQ